jgi:anaerobic dimethyl sulfoxide reductase subunit A
MTTADGIGGADRLDNDIKLIYAVASNILINQHANVNRSVKMLQDESRVEFIVVQDQFMTPSAKFADVILPACTQFETWGVEDGWKYGDEVILMPKLVEPLGHQERLSHLREIAERLGIGGAHTGGRDEHGWSRCLDHYRATRRSPTPTNSSNEHCVCQAGDGLPSRLKTSAPIPKRIRSTRRRADEIFRSVVARTAR